MKKPWILLLVSTMAALGQAQAQEPIEPKEADHKLVAYGKDKRQVLHLWLPKTKAPAPLVLHYHGGGFVVGDIRKRRTAERLRCAMQPGSRMPTGSAGC